jgi:hypothetical protein
MDLTLRLGAARERSLAGLVAIATIPLGTLLAASAQVVALIALLVAMLVAAGHRAATEVPGPST